MIGTAKVRNKNKSTCTYAPKFVVFQINTINGNNKFIKYGLNSGEISLILLQPPQFVSVYFETTMGGWVPDVNFWCDSIQ